MGNFKLAASVKAMVRMLDQDMMKDESELASAGCRPEVEIPVARESHRQLIFGLLVHSPRVSPTLISIQQISCNCCVCCDNLKMGLACYNRLP